MKVSVRPRLSALLMLLLFVGGGPGVAGVDTILFHLNHAKDIPRDHVEGTGAGCHAETCLVTFAVGEGRFLPAPAHGPVLRPGAESVARLLDATPRTGFAPRITTLPRSPPAVTR